MPKPSQRHARAATFQLAEVAIIGPMVCAILTAIRHWRYWGHDWGASDAAGQSQLEVALRLCAL